MAKEVKYRATAKLKQIRKLIKDKEVSQLALSAQVGVNHIYLNAVLKQRAKLTEDLYTRLLFFLERWDT